MQRKADGLAIHKQTLMTFHNRKSLQWAKKSSRVWTELQHGIEFNNTELFSRKLRVFQKRDFGQFANFLLIAPGQKRGFGEEMRTPGNRQKPSNIKHFRHIGGQRRRTLFSSPKKELDRIRSVFCKVGQGFDLRRTHLLLPITFLLMKCERWFFVPTEQFAVQTSC